MYSRHVHIDMDSWLTKRINIGGGSVGTGRVSSIETSGTGADELGLVWSCWLSENSAKRFGVMNCLFGFDDAFGEVWLPPSSYRPISLLPSFSKILEKVLLIRIYPIINDRMMKTQFSFRNHHSTIHQVHRITDIISSSLETKNHCDAVFLDVAQAFDRVWSRTSLQTPLPPGSFISHT